MAESLTTWVSKLAFAPLAFVDVETTGLRDTDECWQVGVIQYDLGEAQPPLEFYANTTVAPSPELAEKFGTTAEKLAAFDPFPVIADPLREALADRYFVAWNARFDWYKLLHTYRVHGLTPPRVRGVECIMSAYARGFLGWDRVALSSAADRCGVVLDNAHDALADITATVGIWEFLRIHNETKTKNERRL